MCLCGCSCYGLVVQQYFHFRQVRKLFIARHEDNTGPADEVYKADTLCCSALHGVMQLPKFAAAAVIDLRENQNLPVGSLHIRIKQFQH